MNFNIVPKKLSKPFSVFIPILAEKIYYYCPVFVNCKSTMVNLVEFDMVDFDIIPDKDWLHASYTPVDCRTQVVNFQFSNEPVFDWESNSTVPRVV